MTEATKQVHKRLSDIERYIDDALRYMKEAGDNAVANCDTATAIELVKSRCSAQNAKGMIARLGADFTVKLGVCTPRKKK